MYSLIQVAAFSTLLWLWMIMILALFPLTILRVLLVLETLNLLSLMAAGLKTLNYALFLSVMIISAGEAVIGLALLASTLRNPISFSSKMTY